MRDRRWQPTPWYRAVSAAVGQVKLSVPCIPGRGGLVPCRWMRSEGGHGGAVGSRARRYGAVELYRKLAATEPAAYQPKPRPGTAQPGHTRGRAGTPPGRVRRHRRGRPPVSPAGRHRPVPAMPQPKSQILAPMPPAATRSFCQTRRTNFGLSDSIRWGSLGSVAPARNCTAAIRQGCAVTGRGRGRIWRRSVGQLSCSVGAWTRRPCWP
jgi:hypothetical protein